MTGTRGCPGALHTSAGATALGPEAPSRGAASAEPRAGLASPALLPPLPCTSGGTRSPSYAAEREGQHIQHEHTGEFVTLQVMYSQKHL